MTTLATVVTDYNQLQNDLSSLLNTAIDKLNPDKVTTPQIIALINQVQNELTVTFNNAHTQLQTLGVL